MEEFPSVGRLTPVLLRNFPRGKRVVDIEVSLFIGTVWTKETPYRRSSHAETVNGVHVVSTLYLCRGTRVVYRRKIV